MYVYMYMCIYVYICMHIFICIYVYMYIQIYVSVCRYMKPQTQVLGASVGKPRGLQAAAGLGSAEIQRGLDSSFKEQQHNTYMYMYIYMCIYIWHIYICMYIYMGLGFRETSQYVGGCNNITCIRIYIGVNGI